MSIFISFSGIARQEFAIKFLDFFNSYGLKCWYDQHELYLGDELHSTIINKGINKSNYCVLIINQKYLDSNWPCEESDYFFQRYKNGEDIVIFPILLDISKEDIANSRLKYLLSIKYQFIHTGDSIEQIGFQIINRIFQDKKKDCKFHTFDDMIDYFKRLPITNSIDIYNALIAFNDFDETNYRDRTIFLICLIRLFNNNPYEKTIRKISYMIYENKKISFDTYKIIESILLLSISNSLD
ncbi:MAG: toll/interleukin-1 receptor domain-containing protein [Clostridia bacterium]|nr:toll/interleukin-1 receptor domain-containing protein [Clostridia bacterium]